VEVMTFARLGKMYGAYTYKREVDRSPQCPRADADENQKHPRLARC